MVDCSLRVGSDLLLQANIGVSFMSESKMGSELDRHTGSVSGVVPDCERSTS